MKITEILDINKTVNAPWSICFERDGTEDVAILQDANGDELATSRPFWMPEGDDPIPSTLLAMKLMEATPALSEILETLLDQIRSLEGESSVIDEDLMQGDSFKEAVTLLGRLKRQETSRHSETHEQSGDRDEGLLVPMGTPLIPGRLYLHLYHGRHNLDEQMDDWGFDGPTFGPLASVVQTYSTTVRISGEHGHDLWLATTSDMIVWNGSYFGDMSVFVACDSQKG